MAGISVESPKTVSAIPNREAYQAGIICLGAGEYLVRSKSNPTQAHIVCKTGGMINDRVPAWECDCKGYQYRGKCRHISQARGYDVAVECGYDVPTLEEIDYYAKLEDWAEDRARRGIPISAP